MNGKRTPIFTFWRTRKPTYLSLILLAMVLFGALASIFYAYTVDDAFITFRYARNLVVGLGPVFNPGERVEGYTSLLWMLLMAIVQALQWDQVQMAKVIGLACSLLTIVVTYKLAWSMSRWPRPVAWLAILGLATNSAFALNTVVGLETPFYTLLLMLAVFCLLREAKKGGWWLSTLLFALAALTRPEGLAVFGLTWLYQILLARERVRVALARLVLFGAFVGGHLLWRWAYYGEWLPATYYAKTGDLLPRLEAGLLYVVEFMIGPGLFLIAGYLLALRQRGRQLGYLLWLCSGYVGVVVWEGGDWMPGLRFWVPILPFLYLLLAEGLVGIYHQLRKVAEKRHKAVAWLGIAILGILYFVLALGQTAAIGWYAHERAQGYEKAHRYLATWLRENTPPGASVALMDIGMVGYYSHLRIIDLTGLTEEHIAHAPGAFQEKVYDPTYVLDQEPAYVVLVSTDGDLVPDFPIDLQIYKSPLFQTNYEYAFKLAHLGDGDGPGYYLLVFERRQASAQRTQQCRMTRTLVRLDPGPGKSLESQHPFGARRINRMTRLELFQLISASFNASTLAVGTLHSVC
jgi:arabinofuranosyltransferase